MPRRYKKSYGRRRGYKRPARRTYRRTRRTKRRYPVGLGPSGPAGFPKKVLVKLKMSYYINETIASTDITLRGNDLNDPLDVHGAAQPAGYDYWSSIYSNYRVYKTKFSVVFLNEGSTTNVFGYLIWNNDSANLSALTHDDAMACTYAQYRVMMPHTSGANRGKITAQNRPRTLIGDEEALEETPVGNSPSHPTYLHILTKNNDSTTIMVHFEWLVEFSKPQDVLDT